jgi:plastocyanin
MMQKKILATIVLANIAIGFAVGSVAAVPANVTIDNFAFTLPSITVQAGTQVTWLNRDDIPHTVVSADDPRVFKSSPLDTGDQFAFRFDRPGIYKYFCSLHPKMQGTVTVQ